MRAARADTKLLINTATTELLGTTRGLISVANEKILSTVEKQTQQTTDTLQQQQKTIAEQQKVLDAMPTYTDMPRTVRAVQQAPPVAAPVPAGVPMIQYPGPTQLVSYASPASGWHISRERVVHKPPVVHYHRDF